MLLAGASGLIGTALEAHLVASGHQVRRLVRGATPDAVLPAYSWNPAVGVVPSQALIWADAVMSLNGSSLARPVLTARQRRLIVSSRVTSTKTLAKAIAASAEPPEVWISASATGFYGDRADTVLTELSGSGSGFLAKVAQVWEASTRPAQAACRVVVSRTGMVLAPQGALAKLALAVRFGLAGRIGSGRQFWPWVALTDVCRSWCYIMENQDLAGPVNVTGPAPQRQASFAAALAEKLGRPRQLPIPATLVKAGLGGSSELLLSSQRAVPAALSAAGFSFTYDTLEAALDWALPPASG